MSGLAGLGRAALDLVFEAVCVACRAPLRGGDRAQPVCGLCWSRIRRMPRPACPRCDHPVDPTRSRDDSCRGCEELPPGIRAVRSFAVHDRISREVVHALKWGGWIRAAEVMAERMASVAFPADVRDEVEAVVHVPTTAARRRQRGFDQAEQLAVRIAERWGAPFDGDRLRRRASTPSQSRLHREERLRNVAGAFAAAERGRSGIGEHLVLVDDVWTTGATATAGADALLRSGARTVSVLTFARVLPGRK